MTIYRGFQNGAELHTVTLSLPAGYDPDYDQIKPLPQASKGVQCGECGAKFEHGKAYGFVCGNMRCPVQLKATC